MEIPTESSPMTIAVSGGVAYVCTKKARARA